MFSLWGRSRTRGEKEKRRKPGVHSIIITTSSDGPLDEADKALGTVGRRTQEHLSRNSSM